MTTDAHLSFDLARIPWIPCVFIDSAVRDCSIAETLVRAHEIREVRDGSPLVTVALHRFLLAVLHRGLAEPPAQVWPASGASWGAVWSAGRFPADRIRTYLDQMSTDDRFDLFGPRAFYQTPGATFTKPPVPIEQIVFADRATTNRPAIFDKTERRRLTPAEAARHLVTLHGFAAGGRLHATEGGSGTQGPLVYGALFLVRGDTLFATLMENLVRVTDKEPIGSSDFLPAWESEEPVSADPAYEPRGYLDLLTHQSRVVRLAHEVDGDGAVWFTGANITTGRTIRADRKEKASGETVDSRGQAIAAFEQTMMFAPKRPGPPFAVRRDRALWSSAHTLYAMESEGADGAPTGRPVGVVMHVAHAENQGWGGFRVPAGVIELDCVGVALKPGGGGVDWWHAERLPIVAPGLDTESRRDARRIVVAAISEAERVAEIVRAVSRTFARRAVFRDRGNVGAATAKLVDAAGGQRDLWMALGAAFPAFVRRAAAGEREDVLAAEWKALAEGEARRSFETLLGRLAADDRHWQTTIGGSPHYRTAAFARAQAREDFEQRMNGTGGKRQR
jgi:hypothetical protein